MDGAAKGASGRMSVEEFERQLAFIGDQPARFCGGEPTLHPDFLDMLTLALARPNGHAFLMTNGVWPEQVRDHITALSRNERKRVGFLFNVLPSDHYRPEQERALHETLSRVSKDNATLGITLYERDHDYSHILGLVDRFGFTRIRYSVASPNVSDPRSWLVDPTRDFPALARIVHALTMAARDRGVYIHSDCGYLPPCLFTAQQLADMYPKQDEAFETAFSCNGPIDIGPGGEAWRCYGLFSSMRVKTAEFKNSVQLGQYFETRTNQTHFTPLYDACNTCELKEPYKCAGGCYALRSVKGMQARADESLVQIGSDPAFLRVVPKHTDALHLLQQPGKTVVMIQERDGSWSKLHLSELELSILKACDGASTVHDLTKGKRAATQAMRSLFERGAVSLAAQDA
jgi:hypothetical protein